MEPSKWIVILTGITLVFAILVLLTLVIKLQGKIFTGIDRKKATEAAASKAQPASSSSVANAAPAGVAAAVEPELVAAIAGATYAN
ncbi:MAG: OadG family protein, partial [Pygmaiobacter massiliensis]